MRVKAITIIESEIDPREIIEKLIREIVPHNHFVDLRETESSSGIYLVEDGGSHRCDADIRKLTEEEHTQYLNLQKVLKYLEKKK